MSDFKKLNVWQKAHELTLRLYPATAEFPKSELYGLTSQMRRCCVSIGSNIAEGCDRAGENEKARFLQIALGSLGELEYKILVARDLGYLSAVRAEDLSRRVLEIGRMLGSLVNKVRAASA